MYSTINHELDKISVKLSTVVVLIIDSAVSRTTKLGHFTCSKRIGYKLKCLSMYDTLRYWYVCGVSVRTKFSKILTRSVTSLLLFLLIRTLGIDYIFVYDILTLILFIYSYNRISGK